jgi:hypothetical protein
MGLTPQPRAGSEDGVTVVLTPIQLAAILDGRELSEGHSLSTRLWGGAQALLGVIEVIGAGALLVAPDPTLLTKVGAGALGASGLDNAQAGARQAWSGGATDTLTYAAAAGAARSFGADEEAAEQIGRGFDIAVPLALSLGLGALRIAAVRAGRVELATHEAVQGSRVGGHTIGRHIGKTDAELLERLGAPGANNSRIISTFATLEIAERAIYQTLRANKRAIADWARTAAPGAVREFEHGIQGVGRGAVGTTGRVVPLNRVRVVMHKQAYNGKLYYILTSYPVP